MQGRDADETEGWVRAWSAQAAGSTDAAAILADRVAGMSARASDNADAIRVTVGSSGAITDLELDEAVRRIPAQRLAGEILQVMRQAQANLSAQVAAAVDDTVGGDSETGRAVLDSFASRFPEPRAEARSEPAAEAPEPVMPVAPPLRSFSERSSFPARPSFPHQPTADDPRPGSHSDAR